MYIGVKIPNNQGVLLSTFIRNLFGLANRNFLYHVTRKANISVGFALINATQVSVIRIMYGSRSQVGLQMFCMGLTFAVSAYAKQTYRISLKCRFVCFVVVAHVTRNSMLNLNRCFERIPGQNGIARFKISEGKDLTPLRSSASNFYSV
jgi:hypothetical protein